MDFTNAAVDLQALPAAEDLLLHPVQPSYKKVLWVEWTVTALVLLIIAAAVVVFNKPLHQSFRWLAVVAPVVALLLFYGLSIHKAFPYLGYAVREKDIVHQRGWLVRRLRICPFNRVQNCSVQSGPLERRWGLASLVVYTAGTTGADVRIAGLPQAEANSLRAFVLQQIHREPNEAL